MSLLICGIGLMLASLGIDFQSEPDGGTDLWFIQLGLGVSGGTMFLFWLILMVFWAWPSRR